MTVYNESGDPVYRATAKTEEESMAVYNESGSNITAGTIVDARFSFSTYRYLRSDARDAFTMRYEQTLTEQRRAERKPMSRLEMATRAGHGLDPDAMRELVRDVLFPR